jgi:hypothetical protein
MAEPYQLVTNSDGVLRVEDNAYIPNDGGNRDWQEYQDWLAAGNTPDPAPPLPEIVPVPDSNKRLDNGVTAATDAYEEYTPAVNQRAAAGEPSVEERLLRLEQTIKAMCDGHMADASPGF